MNTRFLKRSLGILMIADGLGAFIWPSRYLRKLQCGSPTLDDMLDALADNPALTRKLSAVEIAIGIWLSLR